MAARICPTAATGLVKSVRSNVLLPIRGSQPLDAGFVKHHREHQWVKTSLKLAVLFDFSRKKPNWPTRNPKKIGELVSR